MAPELQPLPASFAQTMQGLHRLAEQVIKLTREHVSGEFSLIATPGGFGTPAFGPDDAQVRVEGADLVVVVGGEERREPITTLRAAAELAVDLLPDDLELDAESLSIDPESSSALGRWYGFGDPLLEALRGEAGADDAATPPTLWPEHFDIAIEMGAEEAGKRANYGLSPGDDDHEEPYLYVGPWTAKPEGELWNGKGFTGAELDYSELVGADDQLAAALEFCRRRKEALDKLEV
ncbi:MAG: hypothetical protein AABM43_04380 [Actinomycetota bacterium]